MQRNCYGAPRNLAHPRTAFLKAGTDRLRELLPIPRAWDARRYAVGAYSAGVGLDGHDARLRECRRDPADVFRDVRRSAWTSRYQRLAATSSERNTPTVAAPKRTLRGYSEVVWRRKPMLRAAPAAIYVYPARSEAGFKVVVAGEVQTDARRVRHLQRKQDPAVLCRMPKSTRAHSCATALSYMAELQLQPAECLRTFFRPLRSI